MRDEPRCPSYNCSIFIDSTILISVVLVLDALAPIIVESTHVFRHTIIGLKQVFALFPIIHHHTAEDLKLVMIVRF